MNTLSAQRARTRYRRRRHSISTAEKITEALNRMMNRKIVIAMICIMIALFCSILFLTATVTAKLPPERERLTVSVLIEEGDSLWAIAEEYFTDEYSSIPEYIEVIKTCNRLSSDLIHEGSYLIIPYYSD